jgi:hypothetical protein
MYGLIANWISMKIPASTSAPNSIPTGEMSTPAAALMKSETTAMKATKMKSVMITVEYMVPLSCPKFANADHSFTVISACEGK